MAVVDNTVTLDGENAIPRPALVMLVDDQPMVGEALRRMLAPEADIDFHYCEEPAQALKLAGEIRPSLILLDLVMPEIDGLTLLRYMRANPLTKAVPVVVLSTKEDPVLKGEAFANGANDYLIKWPDRIELLARIRYHSQWYRNLEQRDEAFRSLRLSQRRLAESNLQLQRLASVDGLTGIVNRRYFDERLEEEWLRAARAKDWLTLVMVDIDHFKAFNDHYGHLAGDDCLKAVAKALIEVLRRPADLVARFGGEEFVIVLPGTSPEGAELVAEKVRRCVEGLNIPHAFSSAGDRVTASVGVATVVPTNRLEPTSLLAEADAALYQAKGAGRNRIAVAPLTLG